MDIPTVATSLAASLVASYVGVRYFTGPKIRAERSTLARQKLRDLVSPLRRDVREFRAGMRDDLRRDGTATPADGILAQQILHVAHDLSALARYRVGRRMNRIFSSGWMRVARLRDSSVPSADAVSASYSAALQLLDNRRSGEGARSYVDGLLHRALQKGANPRLLQRLERELFLLERAR
ncbi:hypothetical protein AUC47_10285 [Microbacterium sp. SZ1]|nr:hypothetical protein AUC47_10285 [Microbacterium sp. SZ1]